MFARRADTGDADVRLDGRNWPKLVLTGLGTGALSGFFGIGGGFLIVPCLMFSTGMPIINAIGSSLVGVTAFGATAAVNYAASGFRRLASRRHIHRRWCDRRAGGGRLAGALGSRRGALNAIFAAVILLVASYMLARSILA